MLNRRIKKGAAMPRILLVLSVVALGAAFALLMGLAGQTSQAATTATPTEVGAANCILTNSGHRTVPAGSTIVILQRLGDPARGVTQEIINTQTTAVSVNDGVMSDVSANWSAPAIAPDGRWLTTVLSPTGIILTNPGDQMRFTFSIVLSNAVGGEAQFKPGLLFGGTCTVTAS